MRKTRRSRRSLTKEQASRKVHKKQKSRRSKRRNLLKKTPYELAVKTTKNEAAKQEVLMNKLYKQFKPLPNNSNFQDWVADLLYLYELAVEAAVGERWTLTKADKAKKPRAEAAAWKAQGEAIERWSQRVSKSPDVLTQEAKAAATTGTQPSWSRLAQDTKNW